MKVVLEVKDMKDFVELLNFIVRHPNIVMESANNDLSNISETNNPYKLDDLLTEPFIDKEYHPIRYDDPYPGYEKIPYWMRPDYAGLRPGEITFTCGTDGCPSNCTCSNKSTTSNTVTTS